MTSVRRFGIRRQVAVIVAIAMVFSGVGPTFLQPVHAQNAPVGQGFVVNADDVRFIYQQILVAQDHAAGGQLLGPGPNQVGDPQLPRGLRTVDGSYNNLVPIPDQHMFGAADRLFPRLTTPVFRAAQPFPPTGAPTSYQQKSGVVYDPDPREVTNIIVDQTIYNPAALDAATNPCGSGGFVCSPPPLDANGLPPHISTSGSRGCWPNWARKSLIRFCTRLIDGSMN